MVEFIQHIINGLSLGSIYALIALGYTMVFGVLQLINFAHGDIYMMGAFVGLFSSRWLGLAAHPSLGSLLIAIVCAMTVCALTGYLIERLAYRPLRKSPRINLLITAVGVSLFLEFSGQLWLGADPKFFPEIFKFDGGLLKWGDIVLNPLTLTVLIISLSLMALLHILVTRTRLGRAMRAVSFSHDHAALMGIPTDRIISATFMLGSALAGAAGVMVGLIYPKIEPLMGVLPGLKAFVAAVLGGIGNLTGAVLGAMILGMSEEFLVGYGSSAYRDALAFAILILTLLIKPTGLLGHGKVEKV